MWSDPLRKVRPGEPVRRSASRENLLRSAAEMAQRSGNFGDAEGPELSDAQVLIVSATALTRFAPFALGTCVTTPATNSEFQRLPAFNVAACVADAPFGVMLEPAGAGGCGMGLLSGLVPAQVSIVSGTHKFARINGSLALESAATGYARIIWAAGTSGSQWCLLALPAGDGTTLDYKVKATSADTSPDFLDGKVQFSVAVDASTKKLQLTNDTTAPGNYKVYGTGSAGARAWRDSILLST